MHKFSQKKSSGEAFEENSRAFVFPLSSYLLSKKDFLLLVRKFGAFCLQQIPTQGASISTLKCHSVCKSDINSMEMLSMTRKYIKAAHNGWQGWVDFWGPRRLLQDLSMSCLETLCAITFGMIHQLRRTERRKKAQFSKIEAILDKIGSNMPSNRLF